MSEASRGDDPVATDDFQPNSIGDGRSRLPPPANRYLLTKPLHAIARGGVNIFFGTRNN
jgi:hypothetical protein